VKDRWNAAEVLRNLPAVSTEMDEFESIEAEKEPK
jgi:hypothetical protein